MCFRSLSVDEWNTDTTFEFEQPDAAYELYFEGEDGLGLETSASDKNNVDGLHFKGVVDPAHVAVDDWCVIQFTGFVSK